MKPYLQVLLHGTQRGLPSVCLDLLLRNVAKPIIFCMFKLLFGNSSGIIFQPVFEFHPHIIWQDFYFLPNGFRANSNLAWLTEMNRKVKNFPLSTALDTDQQYAELSFLLLKQFFDFLLSFYYQFLPRQLQRMNEISGFSSLLYYIIILTYRE